MQHSICHQNGINIVYIKKFVLLYFASMLLAVVVVFESTVSLRNNWLYCDGSCRRCICLQVVPAPFGCCYHVPKSRYICWSFQEQERSRAIDNSDKNRCHRSFQMRRHFPTSYNRIYLWKTHMLRAMFPSKGRKAMRQ